MYKLIYRIALLAFFVCIAIVTIAQERQEEILDYHTDIIVREDGTFDITENIRVYTAGNQIKRGIYRDYPTLYKGDKEEWYRASFDLKYIKKNDIEEPFKTEKHYNGIRVYIGQEDVILEPGEYTYSLHYTTDRMMRYFDGYDEVYWNVTGNFWNFPIRQSSVTVYLPRPTKHFGVKSYCGPIGSTEKCDMRIVTASKNLIIRIENKQPLNAAEGFTIACAIDKGLVKPPSESQLNIWFWYRDHRGILIAFLLLVVLAISYPVLWLLVGVDPRRGTIIPLYTPPGNTHPAALRFLQDMGYNDKALTATIINLAVKGHLQIAEKKSGIWGKEYVLTRVAHATTNLLPVEEKLLSALMGSRETVEVSKENYTLFAEAKKELIGSLEGNFKKYFRLNQGYVVLGFILTILAAVSLFLFSTNNPDTEGIRKIALAVSIGGGIIVMAILNYMLQKTLHEQSIAFGITWGTIIVLLMFGGLTFFRGRSLSESEWILGPIIMLAHLAIQFIFMQLIKAPSVEGRKLMDEVEGFKMFLEIGEKERIKLQNPPELTPALFERYLPHAIALGVENVWSEKFNDVLKNMQGPESGSTGYIPIWYMGTSSFNTGSGFDFNSFSSSMGNSFSTALGSSTSPPSSSGSGGFGGGGGGFSGGGGGGGGGGGW